MESGLNLIWQLKTRTKEEVIVYYYAWKASQRGKAFLKRMAERQSEAYRKSRKRWLNRYNLTHPAGEGLPKVTFNLSLEWEGYGIPSLTKQDIFLDRTYPAERAATARPLTRTSGRSRPAGFYTEFNELWYE